MDKINLKFLSLGGILGPILFTIITLVSAFLRSDYNHLHNFISELGATHTPNNLLMNFGGFILSGILVSLFGISLLIITPKRFISKLGSILILIFGLGMTLAGFFSCDHGCPPLGSTESIIHDKISAITFISAIAGTILLGFSFRKINLFQNIALYSILSGVLSAILLVIMINSFESRIFTGLWQRMLLFNIFLWMVIVGFRIFKNNSELETILKVKNIN